MSLMHEEASKPSKEPFASIAANCGLGITGSEHRRDNNEKVHEE